MVGDRPRRSVQTGLKRLGDDTLDEFLRQFPSVKREQAIGALDLACDLLLAGARPS